MRVSDTSDRMATNFDERFGCTPHRPHTITGDDLRCTAIQFVLLTLMGYAADVPILRDRATGTPSLLLCSLFAAILSGATVAAHRSFIARHKF